MEKALLILAALSSTDGELNRLREKMTYYDHTPVYQHQQAGGKGIFPVTFQPGPSEYHPFTNPHEFPWVHTAGYTGPTLHYHYFPGKITYTDTSKGRMEWYKIAGHGDAERVIEWKYPAGTIFMEVLTTQDIPFEVRTRTKTEKGDWRANVYRTYADAEDLKAKLTTLGSFQAVTLAANIDKLPRKRETIQTKHTIKTFQFDGYREDLPEIPEVLARVILRWPFVAHAEWKPDCFAPSTKSDNLSIVSKDYGGYIVRPDSKGCAQCHESTNRHTFQIQKNRDWYGRIRGSDGIFSFSIYDPASVSLDFFKVREPVIRQDIPIIRQ